jgi:hypothetical protein
LHDSVYFDIEDTTGNLDEVQIEHCQTSKEYEAIAKRKEA